MSAAMLSFPPIPEYLDAPVTFVCRAHGPMLMAVQSGETWLYRVHGDHWCSLRRGTPDDLRALCEALGMAQAGVA